MGRIGCRLPGSACRLFAAGNSEADEAFGARGHVHCVAYVNGDCGAGGGCLGDDPDAGCLRAVGAGGGGFPVAGEAGLLRITRERDAEAFFAENLALAIEVGGVLAGRDAEGVFQKVGRAVTEGGVARSAALPVRRKHRKNTHKTAANISGWLSSYRYGFWVWGNGLVAAISTFRPRGH